MKANKLGFHGFHMVFMLDLPLLLLSMKHTFTSPALKESNTLFQDYSYLDPQIFLAAA